MKTLVNDLFNLNKIAHVTVKIMKLTKTGKAEGWKLMWQTRITWPLQLYYAKICLLKAKFAGALWLRRQGALNFKQKKFRNRQNWHGLAFYRMDGGVRIKKTGFYQCLCQVPIFSFVKKYLPILFKIVLQKSKAPENIASLSYVATHSHFVTLLTP